MNFQEYRESETEQERTKDIVTLIQQCVNRQGEALDIGARDGHFSKLLTNFFHKVTALDLRKPQLSYDNVECIQGDITELSLPDNHYDLVFCAEVLEHIPTQKLQIACSELSRVTKKFLLIGVPYRQDTRIGRTTCTHCASTCPPWGHVNQFDEVKLEKLFTPLNIKAVRYVGQSCGRTNRLSTFLLDIAGNPYGTYDQEEGCIECGEMLIHTDERNLAKKICTKLCRMDPVFTKSFSQASCKLDSHFI